MNRPARPDTRALWVLLEREEATRDEARIACERALEARAGAARQLRMLVDYRVDYIARWATQFRQGHGPEILASYRSFMGKLDQAIEKQDEVLAGADVHVQRCRAALVAAETRAAAVRKLIERRDAEFDRRQEKQARKELDEIAQRVGWQARRTLEPGATLAADSDFSPDLQPLA